jgi:hypothetical protein
MFEPEIAATAAAMVEPAEGGPAVSDIGAINKQYFNAAAEKSNFENRDAGLCLLMSAGGLCDFNDGTETGGKMTGVVRCARDHMETL